MTAPAEPLPVTDGCRGKLSRELTDDERGWVHLGHGDVFTVDEIVRANDPVGEDEIPVDFVEATDRHGCTVIVPLDAVEVVMSAARTSARKLPTPHEIAAQIAGDMHGQGDTFEINETIVLSDGQVEVYGETYEGLGVGFRVTVSTPWRIDL